MDEFLELVYKTADGWTQYSVPGGVATSTKMRFTSNAYDWFIVRYGVPTTANDARRLFEFAAVLDQVAQRMLDR